MLTPAHRALAHDLWVDLQHICVFIAGNALVANFLPRAAHVRDRKRRALYRLSIEAIAGCALNLRVCIPSLDMQWMGFRAKRQFRQAKRDDATGSTTRV